MPCVHPLGHTSLGSGGKGLDRPVLCAAPGISDAARRAVRIFPPSSIVFGDPLCLCLNGTVPKTVSSWWGAWNANTLT